MVDEVGYQPLERAEANLVFQVISKRYAGLPVVLTSGYADMVQTAEPQFAVLRKPFQLSAVEKAFREALEGQEREHQGGRVLSFSKPHGVDG